MMQSTKNNYYTSDVCLFIHNVRYITLILGKALEYKSKGDLSAFLKSGFGFGFGFGKQP